MCTSGCVPSTDKYLMNLLGKETPVVKAYPIKIQPNTIPAEVDTTLLTEKPTNVVKYNLDKVNLKAMLHLLHNLPEPTLTSITTYLFVFSLLLHQDGSETKFFLKCQELKHQCK
ncbi:unnamed protein product [Porites lobata]|uniref:Uncharacterized protein n=1 Tax=Porites lobata TaxID=104759 RepID=A0ABN8NZ96_9CNID|nr:unnamed protein product [Porites lobata]